MPDLLCQPDEFEPHRARLAEFAFDVIVTDHHLPQAELPPALAVPAPEVEALLASSG